MIRSGAKRPPLEFVFTGYTLWLKLKENSFDITNALRSLADATGLEPFEPHVVRSLLTILLS
jgi:hypothetical protein